MDRQSSGGSALKWDAALLFLFAVGLLLVYVAAFNHAKPPLFVWASCLLALFLLGTVVPQLNLHNKSVSRRIPAEAVAGEVASMEVSVENRSWMPAFVVQISDCVAFSSSPEVVLGAIGVLPARKTRTFTTGLLCLKRGVWPVGPAFLESSFPMGLVSVRMPCDDLPTLLTILPRSTVVRSLPLIGSSRELKQNELLAKLGFGGELVKGLREYREGDSLRNIHWRASAKTNGMLIVKEHEPNTDARIRLALDLDASLDEGLTAWTMLEAQVSIAASIALYAHAHSVPLIVSYGEDDVPLDTDAFGDEHALLAWFAGLPRSASVPYAEVLSRVAAQTHPGESVFGFANSKDIGLAGAVAEVSVACGHTVLFALEDASFNGGPARPAAFESTSELILVPVTASMSLEEIFDGIA